MSDSSDLSLPRFEYLWPRGEPDDGPIHQEWLVTNGLGSYASSSVGRINTRRYHGLFIPSLPNGLGRTVVIPRLVESVQIGDRRYRLDGEEHADGGVDHSGLQHLKHFRLDGLCPEWEYELGPVRLSRSLVFVHGENTLFVRWSHLSGPTVSLELRPFVTFRNHDQLIPRELRHHGVHLLGDRVEIFPTDDSSPIRARIYSTRSAPFIGAPETSAPQCYRVEKARGLDHTEVQTSPGYFQGTLEAGETLTLGLTAEEWSLLERDPSEAFALERERQLLLLEQAPAKARTGTAARLVLAADQFVIAPSTRPADAAWARSIGQDARSVIAGYPWFSDWGRDTMISLEGLTLSTGRLREAAAILRTFQHYERDGLLPNLFPEGQREGLYHTADATLWFFHAIDRYLEVSGDEEMLRHLFPTLRDIIAHHQKGTHFGIGVDPGDLLLRQGAPGYQLTWMDAKVDGWVVTPRRGKAVEINALWFNALSLIADWAQRLGHDPAPYLSAAEGAHTSFNRRFWNEQTGCLFDVIDGENGDDPSVRPNQVFAISLKHPVLRRELWEKVLRKVEVELVTPVGLRSLAPSDPEYQATYDGDLRSRDAAYHQGTVWAWLIGHFIDAHVKTFGDAKAARHWLLGLEQHLGVAGLGSVSEVFDATEPYRPRGCIAQAWSVAELLRVWLKSL